MRPVPPTPWLTRSTGNQAVIAESRDQEKLSLQLRDDLSKLSDMVAEIRAIRNGIGPRRDTQGVLTFPEIFSPHTPGYGTGSCLR